MLLLEGVLDHNIVTISSENFKLIIIWAYLANKNSYYLASLLSLSQEFRVREEEGLFSIMIIYPSKFKFKWESEEVFVKFAFLLKHFYKSKML